MKKYLKFIILILWMTIIFYLSSQPSSDSTNTTNVIVNRLFYIYKLLLNSNITIDLFSNYIFTPLRKLAHFSEFAILAMLFYININNDNKVIYSFVLSLIYSISDEIHQLFVPGRFCSIGDIVIDACGIIFGLFLIHLICNKCIKETEK